MRLELFRFRYRNPLTGKWVKARYRAERREIAERHAEFELVGEPEIRNVDPDARYFTPHREPAPVRDAPLDVQPHVVMPPMVDALEVFLVRVFLRRYITHCARHRKYAAMNGAARLFAEVTEHLR